jgi:hypothetical protein
MTITPRGYTLIFGLGVVVAIGVYIATDGSPAEAGIGFLLGVGLGIGTLVRLSQLKERP